MQSINASQATSSFVNFYNTAKSFASAKTVLLGKIFGVITPYVKVGSASTLCAQGISEISMHAFPNHPIIKTCLNGLHEIETPTKKYQQIHGASLLSSGILNIIDYTIDTRFDRPFPFIGTASSILFIYANILSLEENIRIYRGARKLMDTKQNEEGIRLCRSAILGIINSLGYIVSNILLELGRGTPLAIVLAMIAAFIGAVKVVYDLFRWHALKHQVHEKSIV